MKEASLETKAICDIIIPVWNQFESTKECLERILRNTNYPYRLIIIDNGSELNTKRFLEQFRLEHAENVLLMRNEHNTGFVKAVNRGMRASNAPYVCILNNDTAPADGWLSRLVKFGGPHRDVGLINPLCSGHAARNMTINEYAHSISENTDNYMAMNKCQGFAMLIKRGVIDKIG